MARLVAGQPVHLFLAIRIGERVDAIDELLGLQPARAAQVPGGVDKLGEDVQFEGAFGADFFAQEGLQLVELFTLVVLDDEVGGCEPVPGGVLGGTGLALGGTGAGGVLGVGGIGREASSGRPWGISLKRRLRKAG